MTLAASVAEHAFRLASPAGNARSRWYDRRGLVLTVEDGAGRFGQGEAAPLPGYSDSTFEACRDALAAFDARAVTPLLELAPDAMLPALARLAPDAPAEARFAIETAILDLAARRHGAPLFRFIRELVRGGAHGAAAIAAARDERIPLVALLCPDPVAWPRETSSALEAGFAGVKAKIGAPGVAAAELDGLARVRALLGPSRCLRLDANGSLAHDALEAYAGFEAEFVEEPFPPGTAWDAPLPVPVALDESLRARDTAHARPSVVAWVLKLGPLGGFSRCIELAREAAARGLAIVTSHTFEGRVGFAAAVELALALGPSCFAAGLAPHSGLLASELPAGHHGSSLAPHDEAGLGISRFIPEP